MAQHNASVTVNAPLHQVYQLFSHFNDFPKFMSYIKEVTYYDNERSHWVADVVGHHEWDAINENWIPDKQIGWRSTDGLENSGVVRFTSASDTATKVEVTINYNPPAGVLGDVGEKLGVGKKFEQTMQQRSGQFRGDGGAGSTRRARSRILQLPVPRGERGGEGTNHRSAKRYNGHGGNPSLICFNRNWATEL